ncbi:hypothetical protein D8Y22_14615 [Salinadaptatus halalkaliphilus]|uniref:Uncharacterized protein n=1 Tax=Salinadaptatus halalkaliphilus TaxID=2419781 RepID=A0A4S3TJG0_9EURY|nr:hypothetical protein [Salinadaptatus halalkaliphilus]THE64142.1 hypothetical protein D8Y22_14615 [Salinadaptatus halalkaliphilus]
MDERQDGTGVQFDREWFRFGIVLAILYAAFTVVLVSLLQFDQSIAIAVAAGASVVFGVAVMLYVIYVKGVDVSVPGR